MMVFGMITVTAFFGGLFTSVSAAWYYLRRKSYTHKIVLFTRYPEPGVVKTRLIKVLGEDGSAKLQHHMTNHMLDTIQNYVCQNNRQIELECSYCGTTEKDMQYWLGKRCLQLPRFSWYPQKAGKFGERIIDVFQRGFHQNMEYVLLTGADIPGISQDILDAAFIKLEDGSCDIVLGPALDGGYYLVGLKRVSKAKLDNIFPEIDWGTDKVLKQQIDAAEKAGIKVALLHQVLSDVDEADDLREFERTVGISLDELQNPCLSIIIPTYNEEANITPLLESIQKNCRYPKNIEIIVCDGGSADKTVQYAKEIAKKSQMIPVSVIQTPKGRGRQLNAGVKNARGFHLLFLHADTKLPECFHTDILVTLNQPGVVAGAFLFGLDILQESDKPTSEDSNQGLFKVFRDSIFRFQMQLLEKGTNFRAKTFELPYGDQAIFMDRKMFNRVGGFPEWELLEDYAMVKNLQHFGHIKIVEDSYAITSARRWQKNGYIKVTGLNFIIIQCFKMGIHPDYLASWYRYLRE